ncbi:hypothetical protein [Gimesia sp.]|uniref:hypothetical protein n=1 Tax=Gimesia sp. TaxID=2024833 RepID=UPI000C502778|nr:hypothetical protein [Gimesia sp.]MAX35427.1 hypothetical protein [Gimesia sp.]|tara:strand:+ start:3592 stop:5187 length:1596 start_codon:yes stop_codon:yes gene_type:complete
MQDPQKINRRTFLGESVAATVLSGVRVDSELHGSETDNRFQLFWGDLHNHNAVGYAKGSLERSIELAREHLDFFAFTGHASWHDMPKMPGDRHMKWVNGFEVHSSHWAKTRRLMQDANSDQFVAFLGYEWHSSQFGDYCMIFPEDQPELYLPNHVEKLLDFAESNQALAIPHHVGYKQGWRGANFKHYRAAASPVVEVFSEHGCTETDRSPYPMIRHSNGGRSAANMIVPQLQKGMRFGFVASTDDHLGYPGAYGEGVVGVWAKDLSSQSLMEAIRARRTYAATGDRIALEVSLNGQPMGGDVPATSDRQIDVRVQGEDAISMVELIRNGQVIQRYFPEDHLEDKPVLPGKVKCRLQYGWGPWADLAMGRTCLWDMNIKLDQARFTRAIPCFQSAPFSEKLRDKLTIISPQELKLDSNTTRVKCYGEDPTKAVVCEIEGNPDSVLTLQIRKPYEKTISARLGDLIDDNVVEFTGVFTSESYILHRLVRQSEYSAQIRWHDQQSDTSSTDWYYVRVTQHNGQLAWSSPIWVG